MSQQFKYWSANQEAGVSGLEKQALMSQNMRQYRASLNALKSQLFVKDLKVVPNGNTAVMSKGPIKVCTKADQNLQRLAQGPRAKLAENAYVGALSQADQILQIDPFDFSKLGNQRQIHGQNQRSYRESFYRKLKASDRTADAGKDFVVRVNQHSDSLRKTHELTTILKKP